MDKIYLPSEFPCTEKIDLKNYFETYSETLLDKQSDVTDNDLASTFGSLTGNKETLAKLKVLAGITSIDKLTVPGECDQRELTKICTKRSVRLRKEYPIPEEAKQLETVKQKMQWLNGKEYKIEHFLNLEPDRADEAQIDAKVKKDFVISVRVYYPFPYQFSKEIKKLPVHFKLSHEITLLASNTLADLRDKILCTNDFGYFVDVDSERKTKKTPKTAYPSGFIFIENVFYNDFRQAGSIDYSTVILDWAKAKGIGSFQTAEMEETTLDKLSLRLGYPYVYQHQGHCEHILSFADARMVNKSDLCISHPYYSMLNQPLGRICDICKLVIADFMCIESDRLPQDRAFLCNDCFTSYNYIDGVKVGNFKAYHYYDKTCLV